MGCLKLNTDYYPSDSYHDGMIMPERSYSTTTKGYRFGFNGMEKDDEVKGSGNQYDYGFRIYDPRLGRFLSVDPLFQTFPGLTIYQYASNRPIVAIYLDGLESVDVSGSESVRSDPNEKHIPGTSIGVPFGISGSGILGVHIRSFLELSILTTEVVQI